MRFISVRDLRGKSANVWRELAHEKEMVITSNGRPMAILSAVDERQVEETLKIVRRARADVALEALQSRSHLEGRSRLTPAEIDAEIADVRAERRRRSRERIHGRDGNAR